jgi:hypothetical protein
LAGIAGDPSRAGNLATLQSRVHEIKEGQLEGLVGCESVEFDTELRTDILDLGLVFLESSQVLFPDAWGINVKIAACFNILEHGW